MSDVRLQPLTRARVASLGESGRRWLEDLPRLLTALSHEWGLSLGRPLTGGSASYVLAAQTDQGEDRVVKVSLPDDDLADEARTLAAAGGIGYAVLHAWNRDRGAVLLERLGPSLEVTTGSPQTKLGVLADTLREAWRLPLDVAPEVARGADKASTLGTLVVDLDRRLGACDPRVLARAVAYADLLADAFDPEACVVAHGDAQPPNLLRVLADRPGAESGHVFVDPDGFRCDPCYDLGVALRDWTGRLDVDRPRAVLEGFCDLLAERSGQDRDRIWAWGFLERVSTGLYVTSFGGTAIGRRFLDSAARVLEG